MFTLKIDNHKQQVFELTHDTKNYAVIGIQGLTRPPTTVNTSIAGSIDGAFFNSSRLEQRNLVITIVLRGNIEENRQKLYKIFPCKTACTIYFKNANRSVKIDGYVETLEADLFVMQERVQISIICPRPYFEDLQTIYEEISTTVRLFEFPFDISEPIPFAEIYNEPHAFITNLGDTDTGMIITVSIDQIESGETVDTLSISNMMTGQSFILSYAFQEGDKIIINTRQGELSAKILRNDAYINVLNAVQDGSTWLRLIAGYNDITLNFGTASPTNTASIETVWMYGGV